VLSQVNTHKRLRVPAPVLGGCDFDDLLEFAVEVGKVVEAAGQRDGDNLLISFPEFPNRGLDPTLDQISDHSFARIVLE
jgi:hypothetical protein